MKMKHTRNYYRNIQMIILFFENLEYRSSDMIYYECDFGEGTFVLVTNSLFIFIRSLIYWLQSPGQRDLIGLQYIWVQKNDES